MKLMRQLLNVGGDCLRLLLEMSETQLLGSVRAAFCGITYLISQHSHSLINIVM